LFVAAAVVSIAAAAAGGCVLLLLDASGLVLNVAEPIVALPLVW
jgi:hypothetical protein